MNPEMLEILCGEDQKKRKWMGALRAYSSIHNPLGFILAEVEDKDEIIYADIDISEMITAKLYHDIIGHYTRTDVVSLNLCQEEDRPLWLTARTRKTDLRSETDMEMIKALQQDQQILTEEWKRLKEVVSKDRMELEKDQGN